MANICNTKFLGIPLDNTFTWKTHIDMIFPNLSLACFAIREFRPFLTQELLKIVNYSYFHSNMMYGIMFWENSYYSKNIYILKERKKEKKLSESLRGLEIEIRN
jgi:hypothetical protein